MDSLSIPQRLATGWAAFVMLGGTTEVCEITQGQQAPKPWDGPFLFERKRNTERQGFFWLPVLEQRNWLVVEPTPLKNISQNWFIFPK